MGPRSRSWGPSRARRRLSAGRPRSFPPASLLTIAAGVFYHIIPAAIAISLGSTLAATSAFSSAERSARLGGGERRKAAYFQGARYGGGRGRFQDCPANAIVAAVAIQPSQLRLRSDQSKVAHFVLASWIGMLPGTLLYIYIGSTVGGGAALAGGKTPDSGMAGKVFWWVGLGATVLVTLLVTRQARQAYKRL